MEVSPALPWRSIHPSISKPIIQRHAEGGATKRGGSKCKQTQTNADKRKQTQRRKRKQTLTLPLLQFLAPPSAVPLKIPSIKQGGRKGRKRHTTRNFLHSLLWSSALVVQSCQAWKPILVLKLDQFLSYFLVFGGEPP